MLRSRSTAALFERPTRPAHPPHFSSGVYSELIRTKISSLIALGQNDEAHQVLQTVPGVMDPNQLASDQLELIRSLFSLNLTNEANLTVSNLLSWAGSAAIHRGLGDLYVSRNEWAKAEPHWKRILEMKDANYTDDAILNLIKCTGETKRYDEALAYLTSSTGEAKKSSYATALKQWVQQAKDGEIQLKLAPTLEEWYPTEGRMFTFEAHGWQRRGDTNTAVLALEKAFKLPINRDRSEQVANSLRNFVIGKQLVPALVAHVEADPDSPLQLVIQSTFSLATTRSDKPYVPELSAHLTGHTPEKVEKAMELAASFRQIENQGEAARLFRHVLAKGDDKSRQTAAIALVQMNQPKDALPILQQMMIKEPAKLLGNPAGLQAIAKGAPREQKDAFLRRIVPLIPYNTHGGYYRFQCNYHGPDKQAALHELPKIIMLRNLSGPQIRELTDFAIKENLHEVARSGLTRLVDGDFDIDLRWAALSDLIGLHLKTGDQKSAVQAFVRNAPRIYDRKGMTAAANFFEHADQNTLKTFREALVARAKTAPKDGHASELLGFYAELAEKAGQNVDTVKLATELGFPTAEGQQAAAWTHAIEDWEITGPRTFTANWQIKQQSDIIKNLRGQITNSPPIKWVKLTHETTPGFIDLARHLNIEDMGTRGHLGVAKTAVMSTKARTATFRLGATGYVRVFVNGNLIKPTWKDPLPNENPGHALFTARLNKGENQIWVRVGHLKPGGWRFTLRMEPEKPSSDLAGRKTAQK